MVINSWDQYVDDYGVTRTIDWSYTSIVNAQTWRPYIQCIQEAMKEKMQRLVIYDYYGYYDNYWVRCVNNGGDSKWFSYTLNGTRPLIYSSSSYYPNVGCWDLMMYSANYTNCLANMSYGRSYINPLAYNNWIISLPSASYPNNFSTAGLGDPTLYIYDYVKNYDASANQAFYGSGNISTWNHVDPHIGISPYYPNKFCLQKQNSYPEAEWLYQTYKFLRNCRLYFNYNLYIIYDTYARTVTFKYITIFTQGAEEPLRILNCQLFRWNGSANVFVQYVPNIVNYYYPNGYTIPLDLGPNTQILIGVFDNAIQQPPIDVGIFHYTSSKFGF